MNASQKPPVDHHYVPVFKLKQWATSCNDQDRLVRYARSPNGVIRSGWSGPRGTGYQPHLYDATDGSIPSFETTFMSPTDSAAAEAMAMLIEGKKKIAWTQRTRSAWARFLKSMMLRHPSDLHVLRRMMQDDWTNLTDEMREAYLADRSPEMPETPEEWWEMNRAGFSEAATFQVLRTLIDNENIGLTINRMAWSVANLENDAVDLMTSDRPLAMSRTLSEPGAFMMMPLSPKLLFIAVTQDETLDRLRQGRPKELVRLVNKEVVAKAERFVFARDKSQEPFVKKWFGKWAGDTWTLSLEHHRAKDRLARGIQ